MANVSPLRYPGGKAKIYNFIKSTIELNNCKTYIEPFAGGAGVALNLLVNGDVNKIIINDLDKSIYAFWYVSIYQTDELIALINSTPINMENWYKQKEIQKNKENVTLLELAFSTLFLNRTNRSGILKAGVIGGKAQEGKYLMDCRFTKKEIIKRIEVISRLENKIELYNLDALDFIDKVIKKTRNSFTFFDPPYIQKGPSLYTNFYKEEDHQFLASKIKTDLKKRKWIVTYDLDPRVKKMYQNLDYIKYYLSYTAQNKTKGLEYMFFSKMTKYNIELYRAKK
jgi:DNA adenine methylase